MALQSKEMVALVPVSKSVFINIERFENAKKVAELFAGATMVPDDYRKNIGNCTIALNYAWRLGVDELQLMQSLYIIHGKPGIEGKLVIALVNACGRYEPLEFIEDEGLVNGQKEDDKGCIARAKELKSGKVLDGPKVDWKMVKAEGWDRDKRNKTTNYVQKSKWNTMPQLMFHYRAAAFFGRTKCPEVILGLQTKEELEDITDLARGSDGTYATDEDLKGKTQEKIDKLKDTDADMEKIPPAEFSTEHPKTTKPGELVDTGKPEDFEPDKKPAKELPASLWDGTSLWEGILQDDMPAGPPLWKEENYKGRRTGNGKTTGLAGWVDRNRHVLAKAPNEDLAKILTKWPTHYKTPFPTLKALNPGQDPDKDQEIAPSSQEPAPGSNDDDSSTWGAGDELEAGRKEEAEQKQTPTINRTGFPEIEDAIAALGPDGPEIYQKAKEETGFKDGAHTTDMARVIARRMSTIVDRVGG